MRASKLFLFSVASLAVIGGLGVSQAQAKYGYQGDNQGSTPAYQHGLAKQMGVDKTALDQAIANKDFDAWSKLLTADGRQPMVLKYINKDNFSRYLEMREKMQAGDTAGADQIRKELGLPDRTERQGGKQKGNCPMHNR